MTSDFDNLTDLLAQSRERFAERKLFGTRSDGAWSWISYDAFASEVDALRAGLASLGVRAGDRVAIVANNRVEWAATAYAAYGLRAAIAPMYEAQRPEEWRFILGDCGARVVVAASESIARTLEDAKAGLPALEHVISLAAPAEDPRSYRSLLARGAAAPVAVDTPSADDVAGFIYTSGTTGNPKGVILSHGNICSNVRAQLGFLPYDRERSLSFLPWVHSFGQTCELHTLLAMGCSLAINDEVANLASNLAEVRPTILYAVPRIFNRIHDAVNAQMAERPAFVRRLFERALVTSARRRRGERVGWVDRLGLALADRLIFSRIRARFGGRLKMVISGSAALGSEVAEFIDALGIVVYEGYGITETSPIVSTNRPGECRPGTVGRPLPGVRVVIDESVGETPGEGEIVVYGPNVMQGYHGLAQATAEVLLPDGGFRSGDLGRLDADGYLRITGRIKELYKLSNGKYVAPAVLEEDLKLSPLVANVMIHGADRPYNVALVVPDSVELARWAHREGIALGDPATCPATAAFLSREIDARSRRFRAFERVKRILVLTEDFTTDNGLLTPTMKLKRHQVVRRYDAHIQSLYA